MGSEITLERDGGVLVVTMARGKANALNEGLVAELSAALVSAAGDPGVGAVVLASASTRLFSGGFDLQEVFGYDDVRMAQFFRRFVDLLEGIRTFPRATVAAVSGHAYAGGALLALACDLRVLAAGDFGFAVNEVNLGLVLPPDAMRWMVPALGAGTREVLLGGMPLSSERAYQLGVATALSAPEDVTPRALALARELAAKPPLAFAAIKAGILEATTGGALGPERRDAFVEQFMAFWQGAESRARRDAAVASMRR